MKIITPGVLAKPKKCWPVDIKFTCPNCACQFQVEQGDAYKQTTEKSPNGKSWFFIPCPFCKEVQRFDRPAAYSDAFAYAAAF